MARLGRIGLLAFIASGLSLSLSIVVTAADPQIGPSSPNPEVPTAVSGTVFVDDNRDGVFGPGEPGVPGVIVSVASNAPSQPVVEVRTGPDGYYAAPFPSGPVRVTFSGWPASLEPAPLANDLVGSSVQFVSVPTTTDFGLHAPADFCGEIERIALACFLFGAPDGRNAAARSLYDIPTGSDGPLLDLEGVRNRGTFGLTGAVLGLAADPLVAQALYASAYVKRHVGLAATPGTIFHVPPAGMGSPTVFASLPAGEDPHATTTDWLRDSGAWDAVGKVGLGGLEVSPDRTALLTVNLADRRLYRVPLADPAAFTSTAIPTSVTCPDADWRPFAVGVNQVSGDVVVGSTCTGQSTQSREGLAGYIFVSHDGGLSLETTPLLGFPLTFDRKCSTIIFPDGNLADHVNENDPDNACAATLTPRYNARFLPWLPADPPTNFDDQTQFGMFGGVVTHPSPMLSDLVFSPDGGLAIGIRDRFADQLGSPGWAPGGESTAGFEGVESGGVFRACRQAGVWEFESAGRCGGVAGAGVDNREGPGGGQFYGDDDTYWHDHTYQGMLVGLRTEDRLALTSMDPNVGIDDTFDSGINTTGSNDSRTEGQWTIVVVDEVLANNGDTFGKSNALGGIESLCDLAPIEIGNRIWRDDDADGTQDATETSLPGVHVRLVSAEGAELARTTTDPQGRYRFSGLNPQSNYTVQVANAGGAAKQTPLAGLTLTAPDLATDDIDSDANLVGTAAEVSVRTGLAGANDHRFDFGFSPLPVPLLACLGDRVVSDIDKDGLQGVNDLALAGITVMLLDGNGAQRATTTTDSDGLYRFCELPTGSYRVSFPVPSGYEPSSFHRGPEPAVDCDNDPATALSQVVQLAAGDNDMTIDGCFVLANPAIPPPPRPVSGCLGNRVVLDVDADGVQDPEEAGMAGVVVQLLDAAGSALATHVTDANGFYRFCELVPGSYRIRTETPTGHTVSPQRVAGDTTIDCDTDPLGGSTSLVSIGAGQDYLDLDACFSPTPVVQGGSLTRLPFTGGKAIGAMISAGSLLCGLGLLLAGITRRRVRRGSQPS